MAFAAPGAQLFGLEKPEDVLDERAGFVDRLSIVHPLQNTAPALPFPVSHFLPDQYLTLFSRLVKDGVLEDLPEGLDPVAAETPRLV